MKHSLRLETLANLYPKDAPVFADIGSDHAYLPLLLLEKDKAKRGFCVENKIGPYKCSEQTIFSSSYASQITLYLGDGLTPIKEKVDVAIFAGMGGETIRDILQKEEKKTKEISYLLLDIHGEEEKLYPYLSSLGFVPVDEDALWEKDIYYHPLLLKKDPLKWEVSKEDILFGPIMRTKKGLAYQKYVQKLISQANNLLLLHTLPLQKKEEIHQYIHFLQENL